MTFPVSKNWYLIQHDTLVELVKKNTNWLNTPSWEIEGRYSSAAPKQKLLDTLESNVLDTLQKIAGNQRCKRIILDKIRVE